MKEIIDIICAEYGLTFEQAKSKTRKIHIVQCRNTIYHFLSKNYRMGPSEISRLVGVDHTTVIHGLRSISNDIETSPKINFIVNNIKNKIKDRREIIATQKNLAIA